MKIRVALLASVLAVGAVATASDAAPKGPSCNLIEDKKGDTFAARHQDIVHETSGAPSYGPQEDALDIISGDLASDGKTLTAVLRVVKLSESAGTSPGGLSFRVQFLAPTTAADENLWLSARVGGGSTVFTAGYRAIQANLSTKLADVVGIFDSAKNEIRISAPIQTFDSRGGIKPGAKLTFGGLDQTASRFAAVNPVTGADTAAFADVTSSDATYTVGAKSCVKPGK